MKKTYNSPAISVVEIKSQAILAGSLEAPEQNGGSLGSRRRFYDFDDEEEDYEY